MSEDKTYDLFVELEEAKKEIKRLRAALEKIANTDYRGNRSQESAIAYRALNDA